jgi:hypothetical protein
MKRNIIKFSVAAVVLSFVFGAAVRTKAYPPYVRQAAKFGAKDCTFCHTNPAGGEGWNERGQWLMAEKDRRKADSIDIEWLAEFKEGAAGGAKADDKGEHKEEGERKEGEKKEGDEKKDEHKDEHKDEKKDDEKKPPVR